MRASEWTPKVRVTIPIDCQHVLRVKIGEEATDVGTAVSHGELLTEVADIEEVVDKLLTDKKIISGEL